MTPGATYTRTAIALHWIAALLIVGNFLFGLYVADLPHSPAQLRDLAWHKWAGMTILFLSAARLLWRLWHPAPALPATMPAWQRRAAHASHFLLYVLFFATPITGWLFSSASGLQVVYFGVLPIPDLIGRSKETAHLLHAVHRWLAYALAAVVALHAAAAVRHHYVDRDDVLRRMLFFRGSRT